MKQKTTTIKPFSILLPVCLLLVLLLSNCSNKPILLTKEIKNKLFTSVKYYGAKGNGHTNDLKAIQKSIDTEEYVFFPKGIYKLKGAKKGVHFAHYILITNKSRVKEIYFEEGALLLIDEDSGMDVHRNSIVNISTVSGDINDLKIDGLHIVVKPFKTKKWYSGLSADEYMGKYIKNLHVINLRIENVSDAGIVNHARKAKFENILIKNPGGHGLVCKNPFNSGIIHQVEIDNFTCLNDGNYSLDFSGFIPKKNPHLHVDKWKGNVKNIKSINSKYGIKTAGNWQLIMENVEIIDCRSHGFFINIDSPSSNIKLKNIHIENCVEGMNLYAQSNLFAENVSIIGCNESIKIKDTHANFDSLFIDGKGKDKLGIHSANDVVIKNFEITGVISDYPIQIEKRNASLINGKIYNNNNKEYSIWVKDRANNVRLENIEFYDNRKNKLQTKGILISQKRGTLNMKEIKHETLKEGIKNISKAKNK